LLAMVPWIRNATSSKEVWHGRVEQVEARHVSFGKRLSGFGPRAASRFASFVIVKACVFGTRRNG
jgi:hypothetical protein